MGKDELSSIGLIGGGTREGQCLSNWSMPHPKMSKFIRLDLMIYLFYLNHTDSRITSPTGNLDWMKLVKAYNPSVTNSDSIFLYLSEGF